MKQKQSGREYYRYVNRIMAGPCPKDPESGHDWYFYSKIVGMAQEMTK